MQKLVVHKCIQKKNKIIFDFDDDPKPDHFF